MCLTQLCSVANCDVLEGRISLGKHVLLFLSLLNCTLELSARPLFTSGDEDKILISAEYYRFSGDFKEDACGLSQRPATGQLKSIGWKGTL